MRIALAALAIAVLVLSGCTSEGAPEPLEERSVAIYLARDGKVAPVRRTLKVTESESSPIAEALGALIEGPTADERGDGLSTDVTLDGLATSVDDDIVTASATLADGVVTIEPPDEGELSDLGMAQVVHTLSQFPDVREVRVGDGKAVTTRAFEEQTPQIVIESPLPEDTVTSPIRLRGTANVFEATVSIEVRDETGKVVWEGFTTATSGTGTRGTFDTTVPLPDLEGPMEIVAFEASAEDGSPLHVAKVPVVLSR